MSVNYAIKRRKLEGAPRCSHCGALLSLPKRFFFFLDRAARPGPARPCERSSLSTVRLFCSNHRCDRGQQVTLLSVDVDGLERIYPVADLGEAERVMDRLFPQYKRAGPWVEERRILGGGWNEYATSRATSSVPAGHLPLRGEGTREPEPRAERAAASAEDAEEEQICLAGV